MALKDFISSIYSSGGSPLLFFLGFIAGIFGVIFVIIGAVMLFYDQINEKSKVFFCIVCVLFGFLTLVNGCIVCDYSFSCGKIQLVQDMNKLTYEEVQELSTEHDVEIKNNKIFVTIDLSDLGHFEGNNPQD